MLHAIEHDIEAELEFIGIDIAMRDMLDTDLGDMGVSSERADREQNR